MVLMPRRLRDGLRSTQLGRPAIRAGYATGSPHNAPRAVLIGLMSLCWLLRVSCVGPWGSEGSTLSSWSRILLAQGPPPPQPPPPPFLYF